MLCDMEWVDPDLRVANGIAISDQGDMLRLDAMLMTVQLNLRKMLEVRCARIALDESRPATCTTMPHMQGQRCRIYIGMHMHLDAACQLRLRI